jgi:hypothetical protein
MSADRRTKLNDILIFLSGRWGLNFYESKGLDDNGINKGEKKTTGAVRTGIRGAAGRPGRGLAAPPRRNE